MDFHGFLRDHGIVHKYARESEDSYVFYLNYDNDPTCCANLSDEDMKIFLNTVERHYRKRIQFEYIGNMRFDLILGN